MLCSLFLFGFAMLRVTNADAACGTLSSSMEANREVFTRTANKFALALFKTISAPGNFVASHYLSYFELLDHWNHEVKKHLDSERALRLSQDSKIEKCLNKSATDNFKRLFKLGYYVFAHKLFHSSTLGTEPEWLTLGFYSEKPESLDFDNTPAAIEAINEWDEAGRDRDGGLLKDDELDKDTIAVIVDETYFKGMWETPFEQERKAFKGFDGYTHPPTMYARGYFNHGFLHDLGASFCEIPYMSNGTSNAISMFIILPYGSTDIYELEKNIEKITMARLLGGSKTYTVVRIPKFRIETTLKKSFTYNHDDLSMVFRNVSSVDERPKTLIKLTKVVVEVDEHGSESNFWVPYSRTEDRFWVDRPFIFFIATTSNNPTVIFSGRYYGPESATPSMK